MASLFGNNQSVVNPFFTFQNKLKKRMSHLVVMTEVPMEEDDAGSDVAEPDEERPLLVESRTRRPSSRHRDKFKLTQSFSLVPDLTLSCQVHGFYHGQIVQEISQLTNVYVHTPPCGRVMLHHRESWWPLLDIRILKPVHCQPWARINRKGGIRKGIRTDPHACCVWCSWFINKFVCVCFLFRRSPTSFWWSTALPMWNCCFQRSSPAPHVAP